MSCRRNPIFVDQKYLQLIEDSVAFSTQCAVSVFYRFSEFSVKKEIFSSSFLLSFRGWNHRRLE
jgi:hypothetical protein